MKRIAPHGARLGDLPSHLRGFSHQQSDKMKSLKGATFGPASKVRKLSSKEKQEIEERLKKDGVIK